MKLSDHQIDASMKAYAKKWLKSLDQPRPSTTLGYFFTGLFILFWSSAITHLLGYDLSQIAGSLIFIGFLFVSGFVVWLLVRILAIIGVNRHTRSALLLSAVLGPYIDMAVYQKLNSAVISHISGFLASIFAFMASLMLDRALEKRNVKDGGASI
jgi:hypothetical protein